MRRGANANSPARRRGLGGIRAGFGFLFGRNSGGKFINYKIYVLIN